MREANAFRLLCDDPSVFLDETDIWYDSLPNSPSDTIGEDITQLHPTRQTKTSCADWELNLQTNHADTATANWSSTKHQYSEEDLAKIRPWLAWIPIENVRKTLENTTQIAKAVTNYPMIKHLASRFKLLNRFRLREIVSTDTIFSSVTAVGGARCAQVFYGLTSHHMDVYGMENKGQFPDVYKEHSRPRCTVWPPQG
jgi:hypothetical protein